MFEKRVQSHRARAGKFFVLAIAMALAAAILAAPATGQEEPARADVPLADIDQPAARADATLNVRPDAYRALALNRDAMARALAGAPSAPGSFELELPAPDGTTATFRVWRNGVMAPELAAQFPEIQTFSGQGVDDPAATLAADLTPHGFHAQVLSPNGAWYIDPLYHLDDTVHASFYRSDYTNSPHGDFIEHNAEEMHELVADRNSEPAKTASKVGSMIRTHRTAVSANSTYTTFHGGSRASAQAAIVTAVNRVSAIYNTEFAIKLQLVANNSSLVFSSAGGACASGGVAITSVVNGVVTTALDHGLADNDVVQLTGTGIDGKWGVASVTSSTVYTLDGTNYNGGAAGTSAKWTYTTENCDPFNNLARDLDVNQSVVDNLVGDANYDIGHVFTTGSGGVANFGVGVTNIKARGTTGLNAPTGDAFYVDFVAHEMGHQYSGNHTWNGTEGSCSPGQHAPAAAFEPGSGSTIQAYAGICAKDNLQVAPQSTQSITPFGASDPYMHSVSLDEVIAHLAQPQVNIPAGQSVPSGNTVPTVEAGPNVFIPAQTPFFLTAAGSDANGDSLTYNWEQRDLGPQAALDAPTITSGPLFRSWMPSASPTTYFPRLQDVASGNTNQNGACPALPGNGGQPQADCWAQFLIPTAGPVAVGADRAMNFRATVRDNNAMAGGVNSDDTVATVRNTGAPFKVTSPNGGETLNTTATITWDVAGTTAAPISASTVSIRMSTDGGMTFPIPLATNVPNDGSENVGIGGNSPNARILVHSGTWQGSHGFFDMSDANLTVTGPDIEITKTESTDPVQLGSSVTYTIKAKNIGSVAMSNVAVTEAITLPAGTSITSITASPGTSYAPANAPGTWTIGNLAVGAEATLTVVVAVSSGATAGTKISNTATLASSTPADPVTPNNSATAETTIGGTVGTIVITKDAKPDGPQDFTFTTTFGNFSLDDDTDPALPKSRTFVGLAPGAYSVTESLPAGWRLDSITCTDPDNGSTTNVGLATAGIDLDAGETVSCTFTNSLAAPTVGLVDITQGIWYLRNSAGQVTSFFYGNPGDLPISGDWDGNGTSTPALYRQSNGFFYSRNLNSQGPADSECFAGDASDIPIVGDWDGDGDDNLGIYRPSIQKFFLFLTTCQNAPMGAAQIEFFFGNPGDKPVAGDWDGDGIDEVGLHRESTGFFYWRNTLNTGIASGQIFFGDPGDRFVSGDWGIVDGVDTPAVFRPSNATFYFRHSLTQGNADSQFAFGEGGWLPVSGTFGLG